MQQREHFPIFGFIPQMSIGAGTRRQELNQDLPFCGRAPGRWVTICWRVCISRELNCKWKQDFSPDTLIWGSGHPNHGLTSCTTKPISQTYLLVWFPLKLSEVLLYIELRCHLICYFIASSPGLPSQWKVWGIHTEVYYVDMFVVVSGYLRQRRKPQSLQGSKPLQSK